MNWRVMTFTVLCSVLRSETALSIAAPTPPSQAPPISISARVEPRTVTIGTPLRYTIRIEAPKEIELVVPLLAERIGDFFITDFGENPTREENGKLIIERWYTLVTYEVGDQVVPAPTVQYRLPGTDLSSVEGRDTLVIVESLAAKAGGEPRLPPIKPPAEVPRDYRPYFYTGAGVLLILALVALLMRWLNRPRAARAAPPRPAHEVALEALARLNAKRYFEAGEHKEYYVRLTQIVREYIERRFHLRAPEMTTEEFLLAAQRDPLLGSTHRASLAQFLSEADLVKFARHVPRREDGERALQAARQFVESTRVQTEVSRAAA